MSNKLRRLFKNIKEIDPPKVLAGFILSRIEKEKNRRAKRQLIFSYFGLVGSFALAISVGIFFGQAFLQSEFWSMFSLVFSDITIVAMNWDTFMQSLLETFPAVYAAILLMPIFTMLISANFYYSSKAAYMHKFILIYMTIDTKEIVKSRKFKIAAGVVGALLVVFISFAGGVAVGLHKAKFSYQWGRNYERNFMGFGPGGGPMMGNNANHGGMMNLPQDIEGRGFRNAHGLAGTIVSISGNNLIVKDRDNKENTIAVSDKTIIKDRANDLKISDLKTSEQIVVMGTPNDQGVVNADLIRVFPSSPSIIGNSGDNSNNSNTDNINNNN